MENPTPKFYLRSLKGPEKAYLEFGWVYPCGFSVSGNDQKKSLESKIQTPLQGRRKIPSKRLKLKRKWKKIVEELQMKAGGFRLEMKGSE
jgi:hypothetical protein